nr:immunoglobulin light chain junction region [Macaca mulatta]MOW56828.1 immunoglobulin light chain junction region [Macaca mulatta]
DYYCQVYDGSTYIF